MRWRFLDDGPDLDARDDTIDRIDAWWTAFASRADELESRFAGKGDFDLVPWMRKELGRVHAALMWEYGRAVDQPGHRLVVTPEHRYELTELTRTLIGRAPEIAGWEFYTGRLPESVEHAQHMVESRTGGSLVDVSVAISPGEHRMLDLQFVSPSSSAEHDAFVAAESLLGEQALNTWVGAVSASRPKRGLRSKRSPGGIPVDQLAESFATERRKVLGSMPALPYHEWIAETEWSLLQLQPEEADDYARSDDLVVAVTGSVELWRATHRGGRFASERFSRQGETFVYVKIDGSEGLEGSVFEGRDDIEDALSAVLTPAGLGGVVGGGTGLRYSYVDVALTDLAAGLDAIRTCLEAGRIPNRTWVLFFDRIWWDEWVGIYPSTPPPPAGGRASKEAGP